MLELKSLLEQSTELPSLPEIYMKVSGLLESDASDAIQIGEAVQTDPNLTARILKVINSAYYGMQNTVTSIPQAVTLLGRQLLQQILTSSVLAGVFKDVEIANFSMRDFWEHSIKTAIIARHLALQNRNIIDHEAFFTAGLLHDIGRLVVAKEAPDLVADIDDLVKKEHANVIQLEREQLGITHVEVGVAMMKNWGMPSLLTQCVLNHHEVNHDSPFAIESSIVYLANRLSHSELATDEKEMQSILSTIPDWETVDCTPEQIYIACELASEQWYEVMDSLGM